MDKQLSRLKEIYQTQGVFGIIHSAFDWFRFQGKHIIRNQIYGVPGINEICLRKSVDELEGLIKKESSAKDAFNTVQNYRGYGNYRSLEPMQESDSLDEFLRYVADTEPQTVAEIGTARGGTFYLMTRYLSSATQFISVNLGWSFGYQFRIDLFRHFDRDRKLDFVIGNSHNQDTYDKLEEKIDDGIDFLFIDGDHSYSGVREDFETYKEFVNEGGIIGFHDIQHEHSRVGVDELWAEIKDEYQTETFGISPERSTGGIGLIHIE